MTDTVVVELDPPTTTSTRTVPVLWAAIAILLSTAVASALLGVGRDDDRPAAERLAAASDAAIEEDFAFEISVASSAQPNPPSIRLVGSFDAETTRVQATSEGPGPDLEFVVDGATQYIKIPPDSGLSGGTTGKPWLRMDISAFVDPERSGTASSNPLDTFRQLDAITGPIVRVGKETVRGEPTVHFRTTVDVAKTLPPGRITADLDLLRNVPIDVWLDDHDRPRRYRQTLELPFDNKNQKVITTMESFDYGKPVTVDLPPPDQVGEFDVSALLPAPTPPTTG